jgi:hypothetical protein
MRKWLMVGLMAGSLALPASAQASTLSKSGGRYAVKSFIRGMFNRMDNGKSWWVESAGGCVRLRSNKIGCDTTISIWTRHDDVVYCDQMYYATQTPGRVNVTWQGDPDCHF